MNNENAIVILIAGNSSRFGMETKKQFLQIENKPIFMHTLINLMQFPFDKTLIVCQKDEKEEVKSMFEKYSNEYAYIKPEFIEGGNSRVESVYNAMEYLSKNNAPKYVFIHDGVRPNISKNDIEKLYDKLKEKKAAILAVKMADTVKKIDDDNRIIETIERQQLYRAATPQAFLFSYYHKAVKRYVEIEKMCFPVTDDAEIYNRYAGDVYVVECSSKNIKITTKDDLFMLFKETSQL